MQENVLKTGASNVPEVSFNFTICVFSRNFETGSSGEISAVGPGKVVRRVRSCISVSHPAFLQKKQLLWIRVTCLYLLRLTAPAVFQSVLLPSAKPFPPIRKFILHRCSMRKRTLWLPAASAQLRQRLMRLFPWAALPPCFHSHQRLLLRSMTRSELLRLLHSPQLRRNFLHSRAAYPELERQFPQASVSAVVRLEQLPLQIV